MGIKVALVGNPNSGKTTLFNGLTGSNQYVGNWPGVTVEKKSGKYVLDKWEADIIDLPGIYSLSTISLEEEVTSKFVIEKNMDVIINIVDASNLERNLFLTHQLLETDIPIVIALNCMDIIEKRNHKLNVTKLEQLLGVPVIAITASKKKGLLELMHHVQHAAGNIRTVAHHYDEATESSIDRLSAITNDRFLAYRYFEDGLQGLAGIKIDPKMVEVLALIRADEAKRFSLDIDMILPNQRYDRILAICKDVLKKPDYEKESMTDRIDKVLTNRWLGLPIFALIMFSVFFMAFGPVGSWVTDGFVWAISQFFGWISSGIETLGMAPWVSNLIENGIFGGLTSVVGFLPQLAILFLFLSLLEDSGYMSRAAFLMDRVMRRFGLSGKSFIPMLLGFGCSVPAMASTRTLDRDEDRKITTMIIPFMSCGAKAPIYAIFAGALFPNSSYVVVFSMYVLGIVVAILSAVLFKKTIFKGSSANYLMELPEYRIPTVKNAILHTWDRVKAFLIKAGTVLLSAFIIIWFLSYFGFVDGTFRLLQDTELEFSLLGYFGKFILPVFHPIGFNDWRAAVAILTGFVAKESVVGTLGILYGVSGNVVENGSLLFANIRAAFTPAQAYAFMAFALLGAPCIAALSAMSKELHSRKWFVFTVAYEMIVAYAVAFLFYQLGSLSLGDLLSTLFAVAMILLVFASIRRIIKSKGRTCGSCAKCVIKGTCHSPEREEK